MVLVRDPDIAHALLLSCKASLREVGGWLLIRNKKADCLRRLFLRAVCCSDRQGWLGFPMASEEGVGSKMRYAALAVKRLVAAGLFSVLTQRQPMRRERVSSGGPIAEQWGGRCAPGA